MLPYKTTDGKVVLSMAECEWECNAPRKGNQQGGGHAEWVTCGLCKQEWKAERLLLHTAYHIAEDSNCTLTYPCGVCGVNSAAQYALDPSSVDGCPAYFVTTSVSWKYVGRWLARYFTQVINLGFETQIFRTWVNNLGELPNEVTIQVLGPFSV